jgi:long-chain fatty acid transport protein
MGKSRLARRSACVLLAALSNLWPAVTHASPLFEIVGSNFGDGGLSARAYGPSSASTYFNPALLPQARAGLELGWFVFNDSIKISLDRRSGLEDVPEAVVDDFNPREVPPVPTRWLETGCRTTDGGECVTDIEPQPRQSAGSSHNTRVYQVLGLTNHVFERYLTVGLYTLIPIGPYTEAHSFFNDEREQYFTNSLHPELYSDRLTSMALAFGLGSKPLDWLSIGVAFTLNLANTATGQTYVGNADNLNRTLQLSTDLEVGTGVAPHFGALIEPFDRLDLSLTVHTPQAMTIETTPSTYLRNGDRQGAFRRAVHSWLPWTFGLGVSYEVFRTPRHVGAATAGATYQLWSEYENRQGEGPDDERRRNYQWSDVPSGTLGLRYTYDERVSTYVDGRYQPTPVPLQTGRTNYVDNDRWSAGAGVNYDLDVEKWEVTFRFGLQAQFHLLPERHQTKIDPRSLSGGTFSQLVIDERPSTVTDSQGNPIPEAEGLQTNNPGWPGFGSRGILAGAGASASLLF